MNDSTSAPVSISGGATPTSTRPSLGDLTEANRRAAVALSRRGSLSRWLGIPLATVAAAGALVVPAASAEARVLPVSVATAHEGPVRVPSGALRCTGKGDFHATLSVRTTKKDRKGDRHVAVYVQERQGGRARMVGYAWSQGTVTKVTVCVNPSRIQGGTGPVYLLVEDAVDGYTRPVALRFAR